MPVANVLLRHDVQIGIRDENDQTALSRSIALNRHTILIAMTNKLAEQHPHPLGTKVLYITAAESADLDTMSLLRRFDFSSYDVRTVNERNVSPENIVKGRTDFSPDLWLSFESLANHRKDDGTEDLHVVWYDAVRLDDVLLPNKMIG